MYYLTSQIKSPVTRTEHKRLIDMVSGDHVQIFDRRYNFVTIERDGNNEPSYVVEDELSRVIFRIVHGKVYFTTIDKGTFNVKNTVEDTAQMGWSKRGGFYSHTSVFIDRPGEISGDPIFEGQDIEMWRVPHHVVRANKTYFLVERIGSTGVHPIFWKVPTGNDYMTKVQRIPGTDYVYLSDELEANFKRV